MNYGNADIKSNGELFFLTQLKNRLDESKKEKIIIFDVGANKGDYSKFITKLFESTNYQLFSFEPSLKTFNLLKNKLSNISSVHPVNFALSNKIGESTLFSSQDNDTMASLYKREILESLSSNNVKEEKIFVTTLDDFCKTNAINFIDFLKIDVEGNELKVLQGAEEMLSGGCIGTIQFEFGGTAIDAKLFLRDYKNLFDRYGYTLGRILKNGIDEYNNFGVNKEVFNFANYVAWKK